MVVRAKDSEGNDIVVFDPAGVYLDCATTEGDQARFRIFGQMKLKDAGLNLVQDKRGDGTDYLCYRGGELDIPLETSDGILTLRAGEANLTKGQMEGLDSHIDTINVKGEGRAFVKLGQCPSFILNEANLTREQIARLEHWRLAHRTTKGDGLHENCPICAEGKRKTSSFKRNDKYRDQVTKKCAPY